MTIDRSIIKNFIKSFMTKSARGQWDSKIPVTMLSPYIFRKFIAKQNFNLIADCREDFLSQNTVSFLYHLLSSRDRIEYNKCVIGAYDSIISNIQKYRAGCFGAKNKKACNEVSNFLMEKYLNKKKDTLLKIIELKKNII